MVENPAWRSSTDWGICSRACFLPHDIILWTDNISVCPHRCFCVVKREADVSENAGDGERQSTGGLWQPLSRNR